MCWNSVPGKEEVQTKALSQNLGRLPYRNTLGLLGLGLSHQALQHPKNLGHSKSK